MAAMKRSDKPYPVGKMCWQVSEIPLCNGALPACREHCHAPRTSDRAIRAHWRGGPICVRIQAIWWQNPSPLDDEDDAHVKDHKIVKEAGTPDGDEKSKTFEEG